MFGWLKIFKKKPKSYTLAEQRQNAWRRQQVNDRRRDTRNDDFMIIEFPVYSPMQAPRMETEVFSSGGGHFSGGGASGSWESSNVTSRSDSCSSSDSYSSYSSSSSDSCSSSDSGSGGGGD